VLGVGSNPDCVSQSRKERKARHYVTPRLKMDRKHGSRERHCFASASADSSLPIPLRSIALRRDIEAFAMLNPTVEPFG